MARVGLQIWQVTSGALHVSPLPERGEHGAVHVLQYLPLAYLVGILTLDGHGLFHMLAKAEHLGLGGGQLLLHCLKSSLGGVGSSHRLIPLGSQGGSPALSFDPDHPQLPLELTLEALARCRYPA